MQGAGWPQGGTRCCAIPPKSTAQDGLGRSAASGWQGALQNRGPLWAAASPRPLGKYTWAGGGGGRGAGLRGGGAQPTGALAAGAAGCSRCTRSRTERTRIAHTLAADPSERSKLACPAKSHLHHGCWREDQSQNQEESARQGTSGTYHQRADAVVLSEHQHPRLPPHRGVPWPPPAPALDSVHAHSRGPHFLAVCPPHLILLHRLCLHQSPLPEAGFSCCHHLQHQSLQCSNDTSSCAVYTFSSGVNAIREWYKLHYMNIMAQVSPEKKINMSYSAEELLVTCFFDGESCDARNFTRFHHPMYGNCYTFNNGQNETILSTSMGGSEYGLQVILYINEEEYNPFLVSSTGAKVIVHRQDEYPFIEDVGTEIETAMATSIGMHLTESFKLSEPYSKCTEDWSDVLITNIYNATYSLQICLHSCFQAKMVEKCGCAQFSQPLPRGANYCNYQQHPNWMYCYYELHQDFVREELGCQALCKEACSFKEWTLTTSLAQWPSEVSEKWLLSVLTWDQGQIKKKLNKTDLAKLLIFYKDLNQRSIVESPANSIEMLLSNIGGQLGLWMSCSVVCVIEIVEVFLVDSLSIVARHQWRKAKEWWARRQAPPWPEAPPSPQGRDNLGLDIDDDLPTFTSALCLPPAPAAQVPGTPPPRYNTLRLERDFPSQLADTEVPAES
uniref:Epithelial sodium channel subunit gamma n=1 Tax=Balaenoptera musculus TaxID=9771 RepID=A0A8C0DZE1_BALMU